MNKLLPATILVEVLVEVLVKSTVSTLSHSTPPTRADSADICDNSPTKINNVLTFGTKA